MNFSCRELALKYSTMTPEKVKNNDKGFIKCSRKKSIAVDKLQWCDKTSIVS